MRMVTPDLPGCDDVCKKAQDPVAQKANTTIPRQRSYRTLRDGIGVAPVPGNKLPGYDHLVPAGQSPTPPPGRI